MCTCLVLSSDSLLGTGDPWILSALYNLLSRHSSLLEVKSLHPSNLMGHSSNGTAPPWPCSITSTAKPPNPFLWWYSKTFLQGFHMPHPSACLPLVSCPVSSLSAHRLLLEALMRAMCKQMWKIISNAAGAEASGNQRMFSGKTAAIRAVL